MESLQGKLRGMCLCLAIKGVFAHSQVIESSQKDSIGVVIETRLYKASGYIYTTNIKDIKRCKH